MRPSRAWTRRCARRSCPGRSSCCPDRRLLVELQLGERAHHEAHRRGAQLGGERHDRLDGHLAEDGRGVGEAHRDVLEDLVVDRLHRQVLHHHRQPLEQRDAHLPVGVGEELHQVGTTCCWYSSSLRTAAILRSGSSARAEPPPNSSELLSAGAPSTARRLRQAGHALRELAEEAVLLDRVLDVERLEEELQRDVLLLEDRVGEELRRPQPRLRVRREHPLEVLLQHVRHVAQVLEVRERLDRAAEDLVDGAAERPPVGRDGDALEDVNLAATELGRLVEARQRLLRRGEVPFVRAVGLRQQLEAAELPIHPLVDKQRRHADLPVDDVAVHVEELDGGRQRVDAPRDAPASPAAPRSPRTAAARAPSQCR